MAVEDGAVLILGYGEMGHAMQVLLRRRLQNRFMTVWERNLADGSENTPLEAAAARAGTVLFCVPASPHAELVDRIARVMPREAVCLSVAKGLDDAGRTPAQVFAATLGPQGRFGVIYGPMIAEELRAGRPGFAELGATNPEVAQAAQGLFLETRLYLRHSKDMLGLSWAAILKNVYVILLGVAEELGLGDNVRGFLAAESLAEIGRIVERTGGLYDTVYGWAGTADLVTTGTSAGSHHRELGRRLARGEFARLRDGIFGERGEGIHTVAMVRQHRLLNVRDCTLYALVEELMSDPRNVQGKMERCLERYRGHSPL